MITPPPTRSEDSHRGLKLVVIALGFALIGGTVLLFVLAFQKMQDRTQDKATQDYIPRAYRDCQDATIALRDVVMIHQVEYDAHIARMRAEATDGSQLLLLVNSCSGTVLNRVELQLAE